jgi:hypothetical protein
MRPVVEALEAQRLVQQERQEQTEVRYCADTVAAAVAQRTVAQAE